MSATMRWEPIKLGDYLAALPVRRRRLRFRVEGDLPVPAFRGALWHAVLGPALKAEVCTVPPGVCSGCWRRAECPYPRVMESRPEAPSNAPLATLARIPRPLALDTAPWRAQRLETGGDLEVGLMLIDATGDLMQALTRALATAGRRGLGRRRVSASLEGWTDAPPTVASDDMSPMLTPSASLRLRMLTPLRLKREGRYLMEFDPVALARDIGLRVAALGHYHGGLPWPAPWREVAAEAGALTVSRCRLRWANAPRFSRGQDRTIVLGGLLGDVEVRSVGPALARLLAAATVLHAGKATALGFGQLALEAVAGDKEETA
ncbi:MAG: CRISPR system precrRNA processing endoribonuclease RAMP protein Cas6 [Candidatus Rokuibacteriota bacterium]